MRLYLIRHAESIRLNDHSHLKELKTAGYENWGLFAKRDYMKSIKIVET